MNSNIKAQAADNSKMGRPLLYKYVGVAGDGELVRLTKLAISSKNFEEVDRIIQTEVVTFLLNDGKGENVNLK